MPNKTPLFESLARRCGYGLCSDTPYVDRKMPHVRAGSFLSSGVAENGVVSVWVRRTHWAVLSWRANELRRAHKFFSGKLERMRPLGRRRRVKVKVKVTL